MSDILPELTRRGFLRQLTAATALTSVPGVLHAQEKNIAPYGARNLGETDPAALAQSVLSQLRQAGLPPPEKYAPFPATGIDSPGGSKSDIIGEAADGGEYKKALARLPPGTKPPFTLDEWRVFTALHETGHYVSFNAKSGDLNDRVFKATTGIDAGVDDYSSSAGWRDLLRLSASQQSWGQALDGPKTKIVAAGIILSGQMQDRIADAATAFYILSNYADTAGAENFLGRLADFRQAQNKAMQFETMHETSSSIRAVMEDFRRHPVKGLSIVEAAQRAALVIQAQPEFSRGIEVMARSLKQDVDPAAFIFPGAGPAQPPAPPKAFFNRPVPAP